MYVCIIFNTHFIYETFCYYPVCGIRAACKMGGSVSSPSSPISEDAPGQEIASFKGLYMGSVVWDGRMKIQEFVALAIKRVGGAKDTAQAVTLRLSDKGVHLLGEGKLLAEVALADISHVSRVGGNRLAYVHRDRKTGVVTCHIFQVLRHAARLCELINQACRNVVR